MKNQRQKYESLKLKQTKQQTFCDIAIVFFLFSSLSLVISCRSSEFPRHE